MFNELKYPEFKLDDFGKAIIKANIADALLAPNVPLHVAEAVICKGVSRARAWRVYLGLSKEEMAERMGITTIAYYRLEGRKNNNQATIERLAEAFGVSVNTYKILK